MVPGNSVALVSLRKRKLKHSGWINGWLRDCKTRALHEGYTHHLKVLDNDFLRSNIDFSVFKTGFHSLRFVIDSTFEIGLRCFYSVHYSRASSPPVQEMWRPTSNLDDQGERRSRSPQSTGRLNHNTRRARLYILSSA